MNNPTRAEILTALQSSPNLTVENLAALLHLTRADIRYHLKALLSEGRVVQMPVRHTRVTNKAGRPAKTYQLSPSARPDILARLADILLDQAPSAPTERQFWMQQLANQLTPTAAPESVGDHISQQLNRTIQMINLRPYQARWEARDSGPQIFFYNCPFAAIIGRHPELCQVDRFILQNLTGLSARQVQKIDLSGPTAPACIFMLFPAQKPPTHRS